MDKTEILGLLAELPGLEWSLDSSFVEEPIINPFGTSEECWRYAVTDEGLVSVQKICAGQSVGMSMNGGFRQLLWNKLRLDKICATYLKQYQTWTIQNNGVPFISTDIVCDGDENTVVKSPDFIRAFWSYPRNTLNLLMADYGMGKSSFCQGVRFLAGQEIQHPFLEGTASFPFVFDLNEFRNQDLDEFIQNRLNVCYKVYITYKAFEKLCQAGIFSVVLDAWDQMHGTPYARQVRQDIAQFSPLWRDKGRVLITCRRTFYQNQLHMKRKNLFSESPMKYARPFTLCGFDQSSVRQYITPTKPQLLDNEVWLAHCWEANRELLERPLTLMLLVRYYDLIEAHYNLEKVKIDAYQLFDVILQEWQKRYQMEDALKTLVMCTLRSGLNRSIPQDTYLSWIEETRRKQVIQVLKELDFITCDGNSIEFPLAAYQEFLWAYFVLQELNKRQLCEEDTLLNRYLLLQEVRRWIVKALSKEENDCLRAQLNLLAYKLKDEVGYSGGNALTLLGDLNRIPYYKEQLSQQNLTDRPLQGADLRGLDLRGLAFRRSNLARANLSYTKLDGADFTGAELAECEMEEYGVLQKCAFLDPNGRPCVVAGTESGGVLTFRITEKHADITALANDTIRDIAADSAGVYTASSDGQVGYIDQQGQLRNVYITTSGLQSIIPGPAGVVYIGDDHAGLYYYNWKSAHHQQIRVFDLQGELFSTTSVAAIRYDSNDFGRYIAYLPTNRKQLVLLQLFSMKNANIVGIGNLQDAGFSFEDICFADNELIYAIKERGIFSHSIETFFNIFDQNHLMEEELRLLETEDSVELAWAKEEQTLFVLEKKERTEYVEVIDLAAACHPRRTREITWWLDNHNYMPEPQNINGFCVSNDGKYIAISGERLAVFEWSEDEELYNLVQEPLEAKICCTGAIFKHCTGLSKSMLATLQARGAAV